MPHIANIWIMLLSLFFSILLLGCWNRSVSVCFSSVLVCPYRVRLSPTGDLRKPIRQRIQLLNHAGRPILHQLVVDHHPRVPSFEKVCCTEAVSFHLRAQIRELRGIVLGTFSVTTHWLFSVSHIRNRCGLFWSSCLFGRVASSCFGFQGEKSH